MDRRKTAVLACDYTALPKKYAQMAAEASMNSACDFPLQDLDVPDFAVLEASREQSAVDHLVAQLQGFRIDLFGGRYAPYQVIFRELSEDIPEIPLARDKEMPNRLATLAARLAQVLNEKHDRKLVTPPDEWPGPDQEPIRLPERLLFNALKLAAVLSIPAILADAVRATYEREQTHSLFPSEIRAALLDAILTNQREGEFLFLWHEIAQSGHSANGYFIANPQTGKRGLLRGSLPQLKQAFAELAKIPVDTPEPAASRFARDVADAILWRCTSTNAPTSERKAAARSLFTELAPNRSKEEFYQLIRLANLADWPDWMCRQIPSLIRLGETRFLLKEEVSVCFLERTQLIPEGTRILPLRSLCNDAFYEVEVQADPGCDTAKLESNFREISEEYQDLTTRNLNASESLELDEISSWLKNKQVHPSGQISKLREKLYKNWSNKGTPRRRKQVPVSLTSKD